MKFDVSIILFDAGLNICKVVESRITLCSSFFEFVKKVCTQDFSILFNSSVKQRFLNKILFELLEAFCRQMIFDNNLTAPRSKNGG